jgi:hypothetical protein
MALHATAWCCISRGAISRGELYLHHSFKTWGGCEHQITMKTVPVFTVDAFTSVAFSGNPCAVVSTPIHAAGCPVRLCACLLHCYELPDELLDHAVITHLTFAGTDSHAHVGTHSHTRTRTRTHARATPQLDHSLYSFSYSQPSPPHLAHLHLASALPSRCPPSIECPPSPVSHHVSASVDHIGETWPGG